jgi:hypothetical protein
MKPSVHHWRYDDGWHDIPAILVKSGEPSREFNPAIVGWHCWVYPYSDDGMSKDFGEFEQWLIDNCPSAEYTRRFNSGDPMVTVFIPNAEDAAIFKLTWGVT